MKPTRKPAPTPTPFAVPAAYLVQDLAEDVRALQRETLESELRAELGHAFDWADDADLLFLIRAIRNWNTRHGDDRIQPGMLIGEILHLAGIEFLNPERHEKTIAMFAGIEADRRKKATATATN